MPPKKPGCAAPCAKSEQLASMGHELRSPLNAILGISESMLEGVYGRLSEPQARSLELVRKSGVQLLTLLDDLVEVARIDAAGPMEVTPGAVDAASAVQASLPFVRNRALKRHVDVVTPSAEPRCVAWADPRHVKHALVTLLTAAVDATPERAQVVVSARRRGDVVEIEVRHPVAGPPDTVTGEDLTRQLLALSTGTLSACASEDARHFVVTLPASREAARARSAAISARPGPNAGGEGLRVLLADDDPLNLTTFGNYLRARGFHVITASDGMEAIEAARCEAPDVILMDVQMPGMDGLEATAAIKADPALRHIPVLAVTAMALSGDDESCLAAGCDGYLTKPLRPRELVEAIRRTCARPAA